MADSKTATHHERAEQSPTKARAIQRCSKRMASNMDAGGRIAIRRTLAGHLLALRARLGAFVVVYSADGVNMGLGGHVASYSAWKVIS